LLIELVETLKSKVLPDCFELNIVLAQFGDTSEFISSVDDPDRFRQLVENKTGIDVSDAFIDSWKSGFLGSIALSLWFMEFDEDNWFSFQDVHLPVEDYMTSRPLVKERVELRLVKGKFPPMMRDLPVLLDYRDLTAGFLLCEFRG